MLIYYHHADVQFCKPASLGKVDYNYTDGLQDQITRIKWPISNLIFGHCMYKYAYIDF